MFLLDTDTLSLFHHGHARITRRVSEFDPSEIGTTVISQAEILRGRFEFLLKARDGNQLMRAQEWLDRSIAMLNDLDVVAIDGAAAAQFDRLQQHKSLRKSAVPIC